jgi:DNA invertase Pin-like site-specific DNA recombinase
MKRRRRLRRLVPDQELIRRRAAGEPLRALASDYDVAHTTLGRYFRRPELAKQVKQPANKKRRPRPRRLVPDPKLIRRRAAGESLRALASDYEVSHTTLGRYFQRPELAKQLK